MSIESEIADRLRFVGLGEDRRAILAEALPMVREELPGLLQKFYANVAEWPSLQAMFDSAEASRRAAKAQETHWLQLFSGRFDAAYVESVRRIGRMHSRIGLDPRWYIGGYSFILAEMFERVGERCTRRFGGNSRKCTRLIAALNQAALIDMELATSVYLEENELEYGRKLEALASAFEAKVGVVTGQIASAASQLEASARTVSDNTADSNTRAGTVAAAAEQASAGLQTAAASAEQLSASINMIREQVTNSSATSKRAAANARETDRIVRALSEGAERIGAIVTLIGQIAGKTNMLALNASIEAARAGEAGKAFDVVAVEVKYLADKTAAATGEIENHVRELQQSTREAVAAIESISGTVNEVAEIAATIANAVDQQNAATADISRNVQQTAQAAHEVSENIVRVSHSSETNVGAAREVSGSASHLAGQADTLSQAVQAFLAQLRAA
ncbi:globin-coupled sensor protein [Stakelama tenebrarum]|uniref:Chemotaxis protein n=1 Tax=Stakelama tenebrarum TaxID=2711215 RepID=A0A6G6Y406_9SPHN|nr:globin-coupled sensor protein [Sphingosinithalassobacter tenebrarum]QIG79662.1 hypothetical protein G5C33_07565 [Sphingosinithalassobacter tenebrarum]